ncbi:MAG: type II toxin-antitoxin system RelE/ParE family toxin [Nitrospirae bacterium]|nr:type II toxin-antitoxin system RelE/ParE family toxin [Candidatus Manganitrophaceae bacterium]
MTQWTYRFRVPDEVAKLLRQMHPHLMKKIKAGLKTIIGDPNSGKALKDELIGLRSFRVSRFRIIYRIVSNKVLDIIAIGPRARIYEETFLLLKKEKNK